ncbi:NADH:ubiquinone reductase (Na(+)-transporting) subunit F [Hyphomonas sp.]|uniref:NADH:ubiquinone reductase (Na(+)-transporting) subunit F n=1 Tax=Hyphomonas sp. TaxID=87 RepID=UPI0032D94378
MMTIIRQGHKWIALILGIQVALWMLSGLGMAILPHSKVAGDHRMAEPAAPTPLTELAGGKIGQPVTIGPGEIREVRLRNLNGRAVFDTVTAERSALTSAVTGETITVDKPLAAKIALKDYSGPGEIKEIRLLAESTLEIRNHAPPAWRIDFSDPEQTSLYVSASNGEILERRNNYWRTFDVFWMVHIMDYVSRSSFNHPLIILSALVVLWLGFSGIALWWDSFRRNDFNVVGKWRSRKQTFALSLADSEGGAIRTVEARPMQSLFAAMGDQGYPLPSTCGGGGTCGLCRVRIGTELPILPADRRQIPDSELESGYRLACQHQVTSPLSVTLPHGLMDAKEIKGKVVSSSFITPDMYELRLSLPEPLEFRAGSYVQVEIPPFMSSLDALDLTDFIKTQWENSGAARTFGSNVLIYRTYSLANAPKEFGNEVVLSIRLAFPKSSAPGVSVGVGSAYLLTLKKGDTVQLRGPFGDFHIDEDAEEIVFIGGGAGIAPIRSMILDQLKVKRTSSRISFWYGARTQEHIAYKEDLEALATAHPNFSWHVALSDVPETDNWPGARGQIHEFVRDQYIISHPDLATCSFYICGPPQMLEAVLSLLKSLNVPNSRIAFDDFGN